MSHENDSSKSIFYALAANFGIAIAKFTAAVFTGSGAMFAEAIHSSADCSNQSLLLWGLKKSKKAPSPDYPLGYGRAIYFWSFIVALMLFTLGGVYSLYEGIHKLHDGGELQRPWIAIGVLIFSALLEAGALFGCLKHVKTIRGDKSLLQWCKETRKSELIVILGEDFAALAGLTLATLAITASLITGNPVYDAIAIGSLLVIVAIFIAIKIKGLLIGQSVEPEMRQSIKNFLCADEVIEDVLNTATQQFGDDVMLAVKARIIKQQSCTEMIHSINACEVRIKQQSPSIRWVFFEPDIND